MSFPLPVLRRAAAVAALFALLLLGAPRGARAAADPSEFYGAGIQWAVGGDVGNMGVYADAMQRMGLGTYRNDAFWHLIEPTAPVGGVHTYRWGFSAAGVPNPKSPDALVGQLAERGIAWTPILDSTPLWATSRAGSNYAPPAAGKLGDFTAFARALAARYGDPTSTFWTSWKLTHPGLPARPARQYEIWNEPNAQPGPWIPPAYYPQVFNAAASGIRAAQSNAQVQIAGLFYQPSSGPSAMSYIHDVMAAAPAGWKADAIGIHPYAAGLTGIVAHLRDFQAGFVAHAEALQPQLAGIPLMVNELGFPGEPAGVWQPAHMNAGVEPDAARAAELSLLADALWRSDCNVQNLLPFGITSIEGGPYAENWQELVRKGTGADTITSLAFAQSAAWARGAGASAPTVHMCGSPGNGQALTLDPLTMTSGAGCAGGTTRTAKVTYRGNPVHDATVRWEVGGSAGEVATNHLGVATLCTPPGYLQVWGFVGSAFYKVPAWAKSPVWTAGTPPPPPPPPPANTKLPTISGTAQQGKTLTSAAGSWTGAPTSYSTRWLRCDANGDGCLEINGATSSTHVVAPADVGHRLRVRVVASRPGAASDPATSAATAVVTAAPPPPPPANTAAPTISGTAQEGQSLTASPGSWSGGPTSYAYQWRRCDTAGAGCTDIAGATAAQRLLTAADVGHRLQARVIASRGSQDSAPAYSAASATVTAAPAPPPANTSPPTVSGTAQQGQTLTASAGTWSGSPTGYSYRWRRCDSAGAACADITSATASPYLLTAADVGHRLRVRVVASRSGQSSAPADSGPTAVVAAPPPPPPPANTVSPTISGTTQEGQRLTASPGSWSGAPTSYAYQWRRCDSANAACVVIAGATTNQLLLTSADVGHRLHVRVIASRGSEDSAPAYSGPTAVVTKPPPPANTGAPAIAGTAQEGHTLSASAGMWSGAPTSYAYQWRRCDTAGNACADIGSATASQYLVTASDVGHRLRVRVVASRSGQDSAPADSAATAVVLVDPGPPPPPPPPPGPPENTSRPVVSGTAQQGEVLHASAGTWSGGPTSYAYQWRRCDSVGANCADIAGEADPDRLLTAADVGHRLQVRVIASRDASDSEPAFSDASDTVAVPPPPANTALPAVSGTATQGEVLHATTGTWSGAPTSYAYLWRRCDSAGANCSDIAGADDADRLLTGADVGHRLQVRVIASRGASDSDPAYSAVSGVVASPPPPPAPANTALPVISGTAKQGQVLHATTGTWSGAPTSYAYQWRRCDSVGANCADIAGEADPDRLLTAADVGHRLQVRVIASRGAVDSDPAYSAVSGVVAAPPPPPVPANTALPAISGTAQEGQVLHASAGSWSGGPTGYAYRWLRCDSAGANCAEIAGAGDADYVLLVNDVGHRLRVRVVASRGTDHSAPAQSAATALVAAPPVPPAVRPESTEPPSISGTLRVGQLLQASAGSWSGSPTSYAYQWARCGADGGGCGDIDGATGETYTATAADAGRTLRIIVRAYSGSLASERAVSAPSGVVLGADDVPAVQQGQGDALFTSPAGSGAGGNGQGSDLAADAVTGAGAVPVGRLKLVTSRLVVRPRNRLSLSVRCDGPNPCWGWVTVTVPGIKKAGATRKAVVVVQRTRFTLNAGARQKLLLRSRVRIRSLLGGHKSRSVRLTLRPMTTGAAVSIYTVKVAR